MPRVFAYCRVSTLEQTTENQRKEIEAAGFIFKKEESLKKASVAQWQPVIEKVSQNSKREYTRDH